MTKLWRQMLGDAIRGTRRERGERLVDDAETAGISPQYLSEIERGRKEPSSEMVEAVAEALGLTTLDLVRRAADESAAATGPTTTSRLASVTSLRSDGSDGSDRTDRPERPDRTRASVLALAG